MENLWPVLACIMVFFSVRFVGRMHNRTGSTAYYRGNRPSQLSINSSHQSNLKSIQEFTDDEIKAAKNSLTKSGYAINSKNLLWELKDHKRKKRWQERYLHFKSIFQK